MRCALDLIVDQNGRVRVIDINPYPLDLGLAAKLTSPQSVFDGGNLFASISSSRSVPGRGALLVLSGRYAIRDSSVISPNKHIALCADGVCHAPGRSLAEAAVEQFNQVARCLSERSHEWCVVGAGDGEWEDELVRENWDIAFHRGLLGIGGKWLTLELSKDIAFELICRDKWCFAEYCRLVDVSWCVPTILIHDGLADQNTTFGGAEFLIEKPRRGFGGQGVSRHAGLPSVEQSEGQLIQPWVRSIRIDAIDERQFEIRVHIVNKSAVSAYLKLALASSSAVPIESELVWLTCIGTAKPLHHSEKIFQELDRKCPDFVCQIEEIACDVYNLWDNSEAILDTMGDGMLIERYLDPEFFCDFV